jgi:hypothetical protein
MRFTLKNSLVLLAGVSVVFLTVIPLLVPSAYLEWTRWRVATVVLAVVVIAALVIQSVIQSKDDKKTEEREKERDRQWKKLSDDLITAQSMSVRSGFAVSGDVIPGPKSRAKSCATVLANELFSFLTQQNTESVHLGGGSRIHILYETQFRDRVNETVEGLNKLGANDEKLNSAIKAKMHDINNIREIAESLLSVTMPD